MIGILNPRIMEDRTGQHNATKDEVQLSVDHPDKILEIGDSADIGKCSHKKADGGACTNIVNRLVVL